MFSRTSHRVKRVSTKTGAAVGPVAAAAALVCVVSTECDFDGTPHDVKFRSITDVQHGGYFPGYCAVLRMHKIKAKN